jgi:hypothetical protein
VSVLDQLTPSRRETLALLADVLIPAADRMPSARMVGVAERRIEQVLAARPDLKPILDDLLDRARGEEPHAAIERVEQTEPSDFAALLVAVAGAYYMSPEVRRMIGYGGQQARPIDSSDEVEDDLLAPVRRRGACYRRPNEGEADE